MCNRQEQKASSGAKTFRINPMFAYLKTKNILNLNTGTALFVVLCYIRPQSN